MLTDFRTKAVARLQARQVLLYAADALDRWRKIADHEFMRGSIAQVPDPAGPIRLFGVAASWELGHAMRLASAHHGAVRYLRGDKNKLLSVVYRRKGPKEEDRLAAEVLLCIRFMAEHLRLAAETTQLPRSPATVRGLANLVVLLVDAAYEFALTTVATLERRAGLSERYIGGVSPELHSRAFYETTRKAFYENVLGANFFDREPYATPLLLRSALELQVRQGLAVQTLVRVAPPRLRPRTFLRRLRQMLAARRGLTAEAQRVGAFRSLAAALWGGGGEQYRYVTVKELLGAARKLEASSPVPLHQVLWIYEWCNRVVHAGHRARLPTIWYAMEHLRPLLRGVFTGTEYTAQPFVVAAGREEQVRVLRELLRLDDSWSPAGWT